MSLIRLAVTFGVLASVGAAASANFVVTSRVSEVSWDYFYGYGPDSFGDDDLVSENALVSAGSLGYSLHHDGAGEYLGHQWTVALDWSANSSFSIDGPLTSASMISSSGSTATQSATGGATSTVGADSLSIIEFTVTNATPYVLSGSLARVGHLNRNNATLYLYGDFGFGYTPIYVNESNNAISKSGTLVPANYRLVAAGRSRADGSEITSSNWDYNLQAVPEPMTMLVLLPGLVALARKKKKAVV